MDSLAFPACTCLTATLASGLNFNCPPKATFQVEALFWGTPRTLRHGECVLRMISLLAISWLSLCFLSSMR